MRRLNPMITLLFSVLLTVMLCVSLLVGDLYGAATEVVSILLLWIPIILSVKDVIQVPWPIVLGIALSLCLHSLGLVTNWYGTTMWWDKLTHLTSGIVIGSFVAIAFLMMDHYTETVKIPPVWFLFLTIISILTMEAAWEIMEFSFDTAMGIGMQHDLRDTVNDILTNAVSGIVAGLGTAIYLRQSTPDEFISDLRADRLIRWFRGRIGRPTRLR